MAGSPRARSFPGENEKYVSALAGPNWYDPVQIESRPHFGLMQGAHP